MLMLLQLTENLITLPSRERIVEAVIIAFCVALITWFFARRKNTSEAVKNESEATLNESEIIQNYIKTVADLQGQIDSWLIKIKGLRIEVTTVEDLNTELRKAIIDIREEERRIVEDLKSTFKHERERLLESVTKILRLMKEVTESLNNTQIEQAIRRDTVRILEMLYDLKERLENAPVDSE